MTCQHAYEYEGHRTYGDNIPTSAQGAHFPGDEPGVKCRKTEDYCQGSANPECPLWEGTDAVCPRCERLSVITNGEMYYCEKCQFSLSTWEAAECYSDVLQQKNDRITKLTEQINAMKQAQAKAVALLEDNHA